MVKVSQPPDKPSSVPPPPFGTTADKPPRPSSAKWRRSFL